MCIRPRLTCSRAPMTPVPRWSHCDWQADFQTAQIGYLQIQRLSGIEHWVRWGRSSLLEFVWHPPSGARRRASSRMMQVERCVPCAQDKPSASNISRYFPDLSGWNKDTEKQAWYAPPASSQLGARDGAQTSKHSDMPALRRLRHQLNHLSTECARARTQQCDSSDLRRI